MFFPIIITKKIQFDLSNYKLELKNNIQTLVYEAILKSKAKNVDISGNSIIFRGGFFRYTGKKRTFFDLISKGVIIFKETDKKLEVRYDLDFSQLCLVTFVIAFFLSFGYSFINYKFIFSDVLVLIIFWAWFFGSLLIITMIRLNLFIKKNVLKIIQS